MSPQLRDSVRAAADAAGCSVNALVVQILASAVGDPARFRSSAERNIEPDVTELERDARGYPTRWKERELHIHARNDYMIATEAKLGAREMFRLAKQYDVEDPAYFVEWKRLRDEATDVS